MSPTTMRNVVLTAVAIGLLSTGGCGQAEFKEFSSPAGKFTVQLPATPKEETNSIAGVTFTTFLVLEKNGGYVVGYSDLPMHSGESVDQIQTRLDNSRAGMLRNTGAKLIKETNISLDGKYPGRNVQAVLPEQRGVLRARIYVVDGRMYQVLVTGTAGWAHSADATKFLESFAVIP